MLTGEPAEVEPLAEGGPGFGLQLGFGVGGDDAEGVGESGEGPEDDDGHQGGFADAMARGHCDLDGLFEVQDAIADCAEDPDLPGVEDVVS